MVRTPQELQQAVDSMFRIRAVESPPDAQGCRRIWHRGTAGAELLTEVDETGRVISQELTLFEDRLRWDRERGFGGFPLEEDPPLGRAAAALAGYAGADRFLKHLQAQVTAAEGGEVRPAGRLGQQQPITRDAPGVRAAFVAAAAPTAPAGVPWLVWLGAGGLLALTALGWWLAVAR